MQIWADNTRLYSRCEIKLSNPFLSSKTSSSLMTGNFAFCAVPSGTDMLPDVAFVRRFLVGKLKFAIRSTTPIYPYPSPKETPS